jgi:hypothetical protein
MTPQSGELKSGEDGCFGWRVRFRIAVAPVSQLNYHCRICERVTGSGEIKLHGTRR